MSNPYEEHLAAVAAAKEQAEELRDQIAGLVTGKLGEVTGAVAYAVGTDPRSIHGQEALAMLGASHSYLDNAIASVEAAMMSLDNYQF